MSAGDRAIRAITAATVVTLGAIAAVISYRHAFLVATAYGENGATAALTPLTGDGLVLVSGLVMLDSARRGVRPPALARCALALGIGATVAVNVLHGIAHGPVGAVIAAWPAVTLVVVVELLMSMIRRGRAAPPAVATAVPSDLEPVTGPGTGGPWEAVDGPIWYPPVDLDGRPATGDGTAVTSGPGPDGPQANESTKHLLGDVETEVIATARDRFAAVLATGGLPSVRAIRRELRVGYPKAAAVRAALADHATDQAGRAAGPPVDGPVEPAARGAT